MSAGKREINLIVNKEPQTIQSNGGMTVILHENNIKVDVAEPDFVEITPKDTIRCMEEMNQRQWEHISTGELFQHLWGMFEIGLDIPDRISVVKEDWDLGAQHAAGMMILGCEAAFEGKNIFVRLPETYLHPKQERLIMEVMQVICKIGKVELTKEEHAKWVQDSNDMKKEAESLTDLLNI